MVLAYRGIGLLILGIIWFNGGVSYAQQPFVICTDSTFCMPGVAGMPRPKGIIIQREQVVRYGVVTSAVNAYDELTDRIDVKTNTRWNIKLSAPLVNKPGIKVAFGMRYFVEDFKFRDLESTDNSFYQTLDDRPLKSLGGTLYISKPFKGNKYLLSRISTSVNGDYRTGEIQTSDILRQSLAFIYGVKISPFRSMAFGVNLSNNFGKFGIIPLFSYNASWNQNWLFESLLPLYARLSYVSNSQKNVYVSEIKLEGGNYKFFADEGILADDKLFLRKAEVQFSLHYEREIHDWLWFGVELGMRVNLENDITNTIFSNDPLLTNDIKKAFLSSVSIFIVPPRKFLE